jgi:uncharacterized protein (DUF2461 family)
MAVRDPFLRFIADLRPRLQKLSPPFVADPSPSETSGFEFRAQHNANMTTSSGRKRRKPLGLS